MTLDGHWILKRPDFLLCFFFFTSIEAYLYFSDETELLQGQEGHRLTLFIFCFLIMSSLTDRAVLL